MSSEGRHGATGHGGDGTGRASSLADDLRDVVGGFDPDLVLARDAATLVGVFDRIERLGAAGKALAARRVAATDLWKRGGHRSPAHWLATTTGMSVSDAVRLLQVAEATKSAPNTLDAFKGGEVSPKQAHAAAEVEKVAPEQGTAILDKARAGRASVKELQDESTRIVHAASGETDAEKTDRLHQQRSVRFGANADGSGWGHWNLPPAEHQRLVSLLTARRTRIFTAARRDGVRDRDDSYLADALVELVDATAVGSGPLRSRRPDDSPPVDDWSFAKVIVRADLTALDRGEVVPGEVCEIAGQGPATVASVWRMIDGGAFVAAVTTRGTEIEHVVHLGRQPTVLQRTALDWLGGGTCVIEGCTSTMRQEIDHVDEWSTTKRTTLAKLAAPCGFHHDLKTHHGYRFGERMSNGKRRLVPPAGSAPSGVSTVGERQPAGTGASEPGEQGDLFDTG